MTSNSKEDLKQLSKNQLVKLAKEYKLPSTGTKEELIDSIYEKYCDTKKYRKYKFIRQLGREGKDGRTFLAVDKNKKEVAVKVFRKDKSARSIEKEAKLQMKAAEIGISPKVFDYDGEGKYIAMELLDINLYDCFRNQGGELTIPQQKEVVRLFERLDECGIFHGDPNPLNFMKKGRRWYIIDYGFAKPINERVRFRFGSTPNMKYMTLGFLIQLRNVRPETKLKYIRKTIEETCAD